MNTSAISRATGPDGSSVLRVSIDTEGVLAANGCSVPFDAASWTSCSRARRRRMARRMRHFRRRWDAAR
jgi:hypothetical protein